jgi:hypothetical protein
MHEFKTGSLKSSSGQKVTARDQATAIAMSEAGMSRHKGGKRGRKRGSVNHSSARKAKPGVKVRSYKVT